MTNNDLFLMKEYSKFIYDKIVNMVAERQRSVSMGLYSETKLEDEKQLSLNEPMSYYSFRFLNVHIYPFYEKRINKYTVRCENWQPKPNKKIGNINVYRGLVSFGYKDSLDEILITFEMVVQEFIKQKIDKTGALF